MFILELCIITYLYYICMSAYCIQIRIHSIACKYLSIRKLLRNSVHSGAVTSILNTCFSLFSFSPSSLILIRILILSFSLNLTVCLFDFGLFVCIKIRRHFPHFTCLPQPEKRRAQIRRRRQRRRWRQQRRRRRRKKESTKSL